MERDGGGGLFPSETNELLPCRCIASLPYPRASQVYIDALHISHPPAMLQESVGTQNSEATESDGFPPKVGQKNC
jgi:hypothetical protein